jgi:hypothetical protein
MMLLRVANTRCCSWDFKRGRLIDSAPKVLFYPMPVIHVTAIASTQSIDTSRYVVVSRKSNQMR